MHGQVCAYPNRVSAFEDVLRSVVQRGTQSVDDFELGLEIGQLGLPLRAGITAIGQTPRIDVISEYVDCRCSDERAIDRLLVFIVSEPPHLADVPIPKITAIDLVPQDRFFQQLGHVA